MLSFEQVFNFEAADPEYKKTIDSFMENRSENSICWVSALDEVSANCLAEVVKEANNRSNGLIEAWPVDVTGRTITEFPSGMREGNKTLLPVDISTPEKIIELIMLGGQFLEAGDMVVICGNQADYPTELRSLGLRHCDAWGVEIVWAGPEDTLPARQDCALVIPELPLAGTGCTTARTGDLLYDLADRLQAINYAEPAPRDVETWRSDFSEKFPTSLGEIQGMPAADGTAQVRTPFGLVEMDVSSLEISQPFQLVEIDSATGALVGLYVPDFRDASGLA